MLIILSKVAEWNHERQKEIELRDKKIKLQNDQLNFVDNKDGTITHKTSNLVWQNVVLGNYGMETLVQAYQINSTGTRR